MSNENVHNMYMLLLDLKYSIDRVFKDIMAKIPPDDLNDVRVRYDPPYDLVDLGNEFLLRIDLPGFSKDDIRIRASDDIIEIRARLRNRENSVKGKYIVRQRMEGDIEKRIKLPAKIRPHEVRAILKHGVLEVYMPKSEVIKEVDIAVE
ncbi:MAG: hypothetical protein DRZ82_03000 [Thermoprotei archaeon]|nr:MAG: hypothetical protein DRZ82_03000 [Thermoprotei archaeon]